MIFSDFQCNRMLKYNIPSHLFSSVFLLRKVLYAFLFSPICRAHLANEAVMNDEDISVMLISF
jgi:hypothetical protein